MDNQQGQSSAAKCRDVIWATYRPNALEWPTRVSGYQRSTTQVKIA